MVNKIILASKSGVRKQILNKHGIDCEVIPSNIDEDQITDNIFSLFKNFLIALFPTENEIKVYQMIYICHKNTIIYFFIVNTN